MGIAIDKTVTIVELIKRRIVGLHQITSIGSTDITDTWEALEEGLLPQETTRHVSMITITLSKAELNTPSIGYQPPLPDDQVKVSTEFEYIPLGKRDSSVERLKTQIFVLGCVQRRFSVSLIGIWMNLRSSLMSEFLRMSCLKIRGMASRNFPGKRFEKEGELIS
ncbi:putative DNA/RNA-binding protein Alba [Helianthus annuus]|nr:putative DNA/RNA-binding protein Alba [Helianthus annuus]KAJ0834788.1 putative DNA/RNA-binding protein Alba [Helianthus annuus]